MMTELGPDLWPLWLLRTPTDSLHSSGPAWISGPSLSDRERVDNRFLVRNADSPFLVEQRAYFGVDAAGRIAYIRAICSGFRPTAEPSSGLPAVSAGFCPKPTCT